MPSYFCITLVPVRLKIFLAALVNCLSHMEELEGSLNFLIFRMAVSVTKFFYNLY